MINKIEFDIKKNNLGQIQEQYTLIYSIKFNMISNFTY